MQHPFYKFRAWTSDVFLAGQWSSANTLGGVFLQTILLKLSGVFFASGFPAGRLERKKEKNRSTPSNIMFRQMAPLSLILWLILLGHINDSTEALRLQSSSPKSTGSGSKKSSTSHQSTEKEEFNIGLIAPHTNFGKREYLRAINSAIQTLNKLRGTKLKFLEEYSFSSSNVHFDMMSLTPSPTSKLLL